MNKLLAWAVLTLAIMAGFMARAEAAYGLGPAVVVQSTKGVIECKYKSKIIYTHKIVGNREFDSWSDCIDSAEYAYYKRNEENSGEKKPVIPKPVKKPELTKIQKYIKIFEAKTGVSIGSVTVKLGITGKDAVGVCSMKKREITINKKYWDGDQSEYDKELTVYHELGHCVLNRGHYSPKNWEFYSPSLQKNCPISIMYYKGYGAKDAYRCFNEHRTYYWNELMMGTFAMRARNYKTDKRIFSLYLEPGTQKRKVGSFNCTFYLTTKPAFEKKFSQIWAYISLSCTRDKVIHIRNHKFMIQAVGSNPINNLESKSKNSIPLRLFLSDSILDEEFEVWIVKVSPDIW